MINVLVTGANGQLGLCLKQLSTDNKDLNFIFLGSKELDVTSQDKIETIFKLYNIDFCVNCAAYTAVDNAEDNKKKAFEVNALAVKYLSLACKKYQTVLIHISTDFVFDGKQDSPYLEEDITKPINIYGETKLEGEKQIESILKKYYIIRTSWLYSQYKINFLKTMLKLSLERNQLNVVNDQIGTPTNALDLASVLITLIKSNKKEYGIYHFSNLGQTTWYGFAKTIFELTNTNIQINKVDSTAFKTKAIRPKYCVLDKTKIISVFNVKINNWKDSLQNLLEANQF